MTCCSFHPDALICFGVTASIFPAIRVLCGMPICFLFFPVLCYRRTWLVVVFFTSPGSLLYLDLCKMNAKCQQRGHCSFPVWIQTSKWPSLLESLKRLAVSNCRYACLKKGSPGQPLVQLLTYVKQQNTRWNVCSRVSSVLTWMPHGLTHLLALSALVFLPAKWAVLQAAPLRESGFPCGAPPCRSARRHHEEKYHLLLVPLQNTLSLAEQLSKRGLQRLFMQI